MRVALVQIASGDDESPADRVERVGRAIASLDRVDLVMLPELWAPGYFAFDRYEALAEPLDGQLGSTICRWALERQIYLQAGSLLERAIDGRLYNTAVLASPNGSLLLTYRKVHVFGYESLESRLLSPGRSVDVARSGFGTLGVSTCYDLRFPELYRWMVDLGAQILLVPAAWPDARLEHWNLLTRARAVENQAYMLACGAVGIQRGVRLAGRSAIIDPWGNTVAQAGDAEEVLYADVELGIVDRVRATFPALNDRTIHCNREFRELESEMEKGAP